MPGPLPWRRPSESEVVVGLPQHIPEGSKYSNNAFLQGILGLARVYESWSKPEGPNTPKNGVLEPMGGLKRVPEPLGSCTTANTSCAAMKELSAQSNLMGWVFVWVWGLGFRI